MLADVWSTHSDRGSTNRPEVHELPVLTSSGNGAASQISIATHVSCSRTESNHVGYRQSWINPKIHPTLATESRNENKREEEALVLRCDYVWVGKG